MKSMKRIQKAPEEIMAEIVAIIDDYKIRISI
jgi:hypothetical protein